VAALQADLKVAFQVLLPEGLFTSETLDPEAFGYDPLLLGNLDRLLLALEPRHRSQDYTSITCSASAGQPRPRGRRRYSNRWSDRGSVRRMTDPRRSPRYALPRHAPSDSCCGGIDKAH